MQFQWARLYREKGLGALVREFWVRERVNPPAGLSTPQVWGWINRSDVAASVVLQLIPDRRFILVVFCAMARAVVRFLGGVPLQTLQAAETVAYGVDADRWPEVVQRFEEHKQDHLRGIAGRPERETLWLSWALSAVTYACNAASLISQGAPDEMVRLELHKVANCAWEGLRRKFTDCDYMAHETAKTVANQILVGVLREYVDTTQFQATFHWERQS